MGRAGGPDDHAGKSPFRQGLRFPSKMHIPERSNPLKTVSREDSRSIRRWKARGYSRYESRLLSEPIGRALKQDVFRR